MIDIGHYRRFYRQKRTSFAGAGDGAICEASTLSTLLSITPHPNLGTGRTQAHTHSKAHLALRCPIRKTSVNLATQPLGHQLPHLWLAHVISEQFFIQLHALNK